MVTIYGTKEIAAIRRASQVTAATLRAVGERLAPGVTTADVDRWVREDTARRRPAEPARLQGLPGERVHEPQRGGGEMTVQSLKPRLVVMIVEV